MTRSQLEKAIAQIAKRQEAVGAERDKLDELICELGSLAADCDEAYDALQTARDALSRLV
jgi:hypothetical protein